MSIAISEIFFGTKKGLTEAVYAYGMHKNQLAASCTILAVIAFSFAITSRRKQLVIINLGIFVVACLSMVSGQGRAALLAAIVATFGMMYAARTRRKYVIGYALILLVTGAITWHFLPPKVTGYYTTTRRRSLTELEWRSGQTLRQNASTPFFANRMG